MSWEEKKKLRNLLLSEENVDAPQGGEAPLGVCLVYPNTYEVGMCNLGLHSVYRIIGRHPLSFCERAFLPEGLTTSKAHQKSVPPREILSLESQKKLSSFDVIAFSLSFEGDYLNILKILATAKIPLIAQERSGHHPLIIAGGVAISLNPEPLADFFDFFFIGEAEDGLSDVISLISQSKQQGISKEHLLTLLPTQCPSVYCPSLYDVQYGDDGGVRGIKPQQSSIPSKIKRAMLSDLEKEGTYQAILPANGELADMFLLEISRGCPHRCHFCAAGHCYLPTRFRSLSSQRHLIDEGIRRRGKVGLVGTAVSDHPEFKDFLRYINDCGGRVGVSSLRADRIDEEITRLLVACGMDTVAIGCEAATEKLRLRIGKKLYDRQIDKAVETLARGGIKNIRLYFMVGLPDEGEEDCRAIITLTKDLRQCAQKNASRKGGFGKITVSLNLFIPKAGTPLERCPLLDEREAKRRMALIGSALGKEKGISVIAEQPRASLVQTLLSIGDRSVGAMLLATHHNGGNWRKVIQEHRQDVDFFAYRIKQTDETLPWCIVEGALLKMAEPSDC